MMRINARIYTRSTRMRRCGKKPSFYTWSEAKELCARITIVIVYQAWPHDISVYFGEDFNPDIPF